MSGIFKVDRVNSGFFFLAAWGLSCITRDLHCSMRELSLQCAGSFVAACGQSAVVRRLQSTWISVVAAHGLSSCGAWP